MGNRLLLSVLLLLTIMLVATSMTEVPLPVRAEAMTTYVPHDPIVITDDGDFEDLGIPGSGTQDDPYVIEGYEIEVSPDSGVFAGIFVAGVSSYFKIVNCHVIGPGTYGVNGIVVWFCDNFLGMWDCWVEGCNVGLGFWNCSHPVTIHNCTAEECYHGFWVFEQAPAEAHIENCTFSLKPMASPQEEGLPFGVGVFVVSSNNTYVEDCTVLGPGQEGPSGGIGFMECHDCYASDVRVLGCSIGGMVMNSSSVGLYDTHIEGCHAISGEDQPSFAFGVVNTTYISLSRCEFVDSDIGVFITNSSHVGVEECVVEDAGYFGFAVGNSSHVGLSYSDVAGSYVGIWVMNSSCHIRYNIVRGCTHMAINITGTDNVVHHNDFVDNGRYMGMSQAYDAGSHNTWYDVTTNEGNYWSDWTEPDADEDGIVDIPYPIAGPASSHDPYPLTEPVRYRPPDTEGPSISGISWSPAEPEPNEDVVVEAKISDPSGVAVAVLRYRTDGTWQEVVMQHIGGVTYRATIQGQPHGTTVRFLIWANDTLGNTNQTGEYEYTVLDTTPPSITDITFTPSEPNANEEVVIRAKVSDASGLEEVVLKYSTDGGQTWHDISMTNTGGGNYEATIPGQPAGTEVRFRIYARDIAGNEVESDEHSYTVKEAPAPGPSPSPGIGIPMEYVIAGVAIVVVGAVAAFILLRRR